ncbi:MAG: ABC-type phosphate uptake system permease component PstC [Saliniramus fredricksonii]|uniref:Phosphate transport system permease protein n=1 Tax=Saliniramus fredricksonii TaxID=1653334 RepID=A0A0P8A1D6_9HYPH|nr:phosphate ABC transporter permease subunit PstC [Saliniramus fredricksonii]KPQ11213.1 MAG: ABC-type phosphate uptake system permease component PstC [Saliniramus fredricksonii]SCC81744.1 phosphate ABC transporter membrane protein 1, PhoT family [Saliniramus fredricksonii]
MLTNVFFAILILSVLAFMVGRLQARRFAEAGPSQKLHSRPVYHGAFVAIWVGVPALVLVMLWLVFQGTVIDSLIIASLPETLTRDASSTQLDLYLSEIKNVANGIIFGEPQPAISAAAERYERWVSIARWAMVVVALCLMIITLFVAQARLSLRFRARQGFERGITILMVTCSVIAIMTTVGIIASLLFEAWFFFSLVPPTEFLFGLNWEPQIAIRADQVAGAGAFGAVPVFVGTLLIATIAMFVATPIGLFSAIYLAEFASDRLRRTVKPLMEILAGIPTVVYGFFAILVVAPALRNAGTALGLPISPNTALAAGSVMGIMLIPFISSLSDDALRAVPRSLREGSLALGATKAETITKVLLPAALPGIMGGILLAVSRAIGETMIVVMAAGLIATLTFNPLDSVTTVTVQIVTLLIGDTAFDNPKTLAAFGLGLVLFIATLGLNVIALRIVQKYREQYD